MKYIITLLFVMLFTGVNAQPEKHAIIFAIGDYPKSGGWPQISSGNDIPIIKAALMNQRFPEKNIRIVKDEAATKAGIRKAIEDLIRSVKPDDVVVLHFSSHGEQVADDNGDETDGYDETIVPYDAILPTLSGDYDKDQASYFRDDEFGILINQLRSKLGPKGDVVVFMDACHSGSGTRGIAHVRGGQAPFVPAGYDHTKFQKTDTAGVFKEKEFSVAENAKMATYIVFSAARAEELNYETVDDYGTSLGSLTYAVSKAMSNLDEGTSYRSLFAKVMAIMNSKVPKQNPVLEGNGADRALFGGAFVAQKPYVEINKIAGNLISVKAGLLSGLDVGAKVEVYRSGTNDPSKPEAKKALLATGTVSKSGNFSAEITMDKQLNVKQPAEAWVFITSPVFKINPIPVEVITSQARGVSGPMNFNAADALKIKNSLNDFPLAAFKGTPELLLVKGNTLDSVKIASNGYVYKAVTSGNAAELKEAIQNYAQYKLLQNEIKNQDIDFEVILVPVVNDKPDTSLIQTKMIKGAYQFKEGDKVTLWIKNNSSRSVYFNILDMQPDGIINPILPNKAQEIYPRDLKVAGGASIVGFRDYILTIYPPFGVELFKVFVSFNEINMETIATTRGADARGNLNSFEALVKKSFGASRGAEGSVKVSEGATFNVPFRIVENK
jgi:metacaspase-1